MESYHEHGVGGMNDAERRAVFDEIKERSQSEPLTGADEDFLRHFEEFLDEALGIGGKAANRWSDEARAAALEARRAKARAKTETGTGSSGAGSRPPVLSLIMDPRTGRPFGIRDPNMPRGGYPETAKFWPVKGRDITVVQLRRGEPSYPISSRPAEKYERFNFLNTWWYRLPGQLEWKVSKYGGILRQGTTGTSRYS